MNTAFPCLCQREHKSASHLTHASVEDAASRLRSNTLHDPTGTHSLRQKFRADLDKRWERVRRLTAQALAGGADTAFGLEPSVVSVATSLASGNRVHAFQRWLDEALRQIVFGYTGTWTEPYIQQAIAMAKARARQITGAALVDGHGLDRELALMYLTASELDGICAAASQQATRVLTHGLLANTKPKPLARAVAQRLTKVGKERSRMLANAMVVKAFSSATLQAFRQAAVTKVGTLPERNKIKVAKGPHGLHMVDRTAMTAGIDVLTAGDDSVCQICEDISDDGPYSLDEAESLLPAHANCRCAFVPVDDERFASVHEDDE